MWVGMVVSLSLFEASMFGSAELDRILISDST